MTGETKSLTLDDLAARGLLDAAAARGILRPDAETEKQGPWFLRALQVVGAWIAALFLMGFLGAADLLDGGTSTAILGAIMIAAAIGLGRIVTHLFAEQALTAISIAGHLLVVTGLWTEDQPWVAALVAILLLPLTYRFFRVGVHRLFACHFAPIVLCAAAMEERFSDITHILVAICLAGFLLLHSGRCSAPFWRPAAYSVVTILLYFLITISSLMFLDDLNFEDVVPFRPWISSLLVAIVLPLLPLHLQRHDLERFRSPIIAGALLLGALAFLTTSAIAASLWIFIIGHLRGDRVLSWLGAIAFAISLTFYYYSLDLTLLAKSVSLIALGAAFLILRLLINRSAPSTKSATA